MPESRLIDYTEFEERAVASRADLEIRGVHHSVFSDEINNEGKAYQIEQMEFGDLKGDLHTYGKE
ncbi:MAG: hypothetical protein KKD18_01250 [Nanoarchaeota archaeon]|nr:hypothetical protein [Nanoarchaeota archaeon]MBU0977020.1 hypothetical protein [Nanoarchaeota archaeon]